MTTSTSREQIIRVLEGEWTREELLEWKAKGERSGRVTFAFGRGIPSWPKNHAVPRRVKRWASRELLDIPAVVRQKIVTELCNGRWLEERSQEVWALLEKDHRELRRLLTVTRQRLDQLTDVDPATFGILEGRIPILETWIDEVGRRIPGTHREWRSSGRKVYGDPEQGPNRMSMIAELANRAQFAYVICISLLLREGVPVPEAIARSLEGVHAAGFVRARGVDPLWVGPIPEIMRDISGVTPDSRFWRVGEPEHLRTLGKGGRRKRREPTAQQLFILEKMFDEQWSRVQRARQGDQQELKRLVHQVSRVLPCGTRSISKRKHDLLAERIVDPRSTRRSLAVTCVSLIDDRSPETLRKIKPVEIKLVENYSHKTTQ